jgi:hypothetical protein
LVGLGKFNTKLAQQDLDSEMALQANLEELSGNCFDKCRQIRSSESLETSLLSSDFGFLVVEKSIIERAFVNLKNTVNQDFLFDVDFRVLLKVFEGLIAKLVLEKALNKSQISSSTANGKLQKNKCFELKVDNLLVEDKENFIGESKPPLNANRVLMIRKTKWNWLKRESKKKVGRIPDHLFFILIKKNSQESLMLNIRSKNPQVLLCAIEKWIFHYDGDYLVKILGWMRGIDVEKLNDSRKIQPINLILKKDVFWCYVSDPYLKSISIY